MRTIAVRNVNEAYRIGRDLINSFGIEEQTRNGPVLAFDGPVSTEYHRPNERVLFDRGRRANPFFHLFESLWMLAGRDDGKWLDRYVSDFSQRYAEDDGRIHGAYGHRWIGFFGIDQISSIVNILNRDRTSRQAVLTMWDPDADLGANVKDKPCNTHIYFRVTNGALHMTVCNRSNDMVWGAYGANAVHMSILHEVITKALGLTLGTYYQVSNNLHLYKDHIDKFPVIYHNPYETGLVKPHPIVNGGIDNHLYFMEDVQAWCESRPNHTYRSFFFDLVAQPMQHVYDTWKHDKNIRKAVSLCDEIEALDWRLAASAWLYDRSAKHEPNA